MAIALSSIKYDPNVLFGNSPYINSTTSYISFSDKTFSTGISYIDTFPVIPYDTNWHILKITRKDMYPGSMKIYFDDILIGTNTVNIDKPQYIMFGIPGSLLYDGRWYEYSNLVIDYVNLR